MGIIKRQSLKSSIVNYIGVFLGVVFFSFIFPHLISEEFLGLIRLLQSLTFVLVALPSLGLGQVLFRFYANWKEENKLASYNSFSLIIISIACLVLVLLLVLGKNFLLDFYRENSALFIPYYYLLVPLIIIQAYIQYFEIFSMVKLRVAFPSFVREVLVRVLLIVLVYLFIYKILTQDQFLIGIPVIYAISAICIIVYAIKFQGFQLENPLNYLKNNKNLKHELMFAGGMLLVVIFNNIHSFIDGIFISSLIGVGAFGIYGIPLVLGQMIQVPYRSVILISIPILREAFLENDMEKVKNLNRSIGINLFLIGSFLFTLVVVNGDGIFKLLPVKFEIAKNVLYIIAAGRLFDMAFGLNSEILNGSSLYKYFILSNVVLVVFAIVLNILLIPKLGINGAAIASSVALIAFNLFKSSVIYYKFRFHCFSKHYLTLMILSLAVIAILYFVPFLKWIPNHMFMNALANIAFKSILGSILFLVPLYYFNVSTDFNDFIKLIVSGKIFKGGHKMNEL